MPHYVPVAHHRLLVMKIIPILCLSVSITKFKIFSFLSKILCYAKIIALKKENIKPTSVKYSTLPSCNGLRGIEKALYCIRSPKRSFILNKFVPESCRFDQVNVTFQWTSSTRGLSRNCKAFNPLTVNPTKSRRIF